MSCIMPTTNININIDSKLKDKAQSVFDALGLDISTAITMLLSKAIYQEQVSFDVKIRIKDDEDENTPLIAFGK